MSIRYNTLVVYSVVCVAPVTTFISLTGAAQAHFLGRSGRGRKYADGEGKSVRKHFLRNVASCVSDSELTLHARTVRTHPCTKFCNPNT